MGDGIERADLRFALPKTRLRVFGHELQRNNEDGTPLLRLPLSSVRSAEFRRPLDPHCLFFFGSGSIVITIAYFVSEYNWVSTLLCAVGAVAILFGFLCHRKDQIVLHTDREVLTMDCPEPRDEVQCFVSSLQELLLHLLGGACRLSAVSRFSMLSAAELSRSSDERRILCRPETST